MRYSTPVIGGAAAARAARSADDGKSTLVIDTLSYLARSGRVPRIAAWAAGMLDVKPIVRFSASDITLVARTRSRTKALDRLAALFAGDSAGRAAHVAVHHANAPNDAAYLLDAVQRRAHIAEAHVTEFTQVMGVHTGPGLAGLAYWTE